MCFVGPTCGLSIIMAQITTKLNLGSDTILYRHRLHPQWRNDNSFYKIKKVPPQNYMSIKGITPYSYKVDTIVQFFQYGIHIPTLPINSILVKCGTTHPTRCPSWDLNNQYGVLFNLSIQYYTIIIIVYICYTPYIMIRVQ